MTPLRAGFVFAALAAGALAACSRAGPRSPTAAEKVTFAYAALPHAALAQLAYLRGLFAEEGLDVEPRVHAYGKAALRDVLDGTADLATVAETPVMFAIMDGARISIIATIQTSKRNEAVVARRDRGIRGPGDLKGKRLGTTLGTTSDFFMDAFLTAHRVSRADVTVVGLQPSELGDALARGEVDAVAAFVPYLTAVQKKLGDRAVSFYDEDVYMETFNLVAREEYVRRKPATVRRVLRAVVGAETFARADPSRAQELVAGFIRADLGAVREAWPVNSFRVGLDQSLLLALEDESRWAVKAGLTAKGSVPNYLDYVYFDGLQDVRPDAVRILR